MCHIFCEQVMINVVTFMCNWVFISFKTFELSSYLINHLILCFFKVSNFFDGCAPTYQAQKSNLSYSIELQNMSNMLLKILPTIILKMNNSKF